MIRPVFLAATLLVVIVSALDEDSAYWETKDRPVAMGNMGVHYNFRTVISTDEKPLMAATNDKIWCQATLNEVPLPIVRANFIRYHDPPRRRISPAIENITHKASFEPEQAVIHNMGKYRCEITIEDPEDETKTKDVYGNLFAYKRSEVVYGNLMVYSSPFFHTNGSMNMVVKDEIQQKIVTADKLFATEGAPMEIRCPATGFPKPTITWFKDSEVLHIDGTHLALSSNGTLLTFDKFAESDAGVYRCTATNEYPNLLDIDPKQHEASLDQEVAIGSPYGWIYPLLVILVILLLLFIIIYACTACKRYQHDNYNVAKREKLLRTPSPASSSATSPKKYEIVSSA